jgi:hypothetical protein
LNVLRKNSWFGVYPNDPTFILKILLLKNYLNFLIFKKGTVSSILFFNRFLF